MSIFFRCHFFVHGRPQRGAECDAAPPGGGREPPTVPADIPAAVGSDGRTPVEGATGTITAPLPTPSTLMRAATVAMLDNYVQAWATTQDSSDIIDQAADNLADCFNPLGLSDDPGTITAQKGNEIKYTRFDPAADDFIDKSGVPRTEIDDAEQRQAITETATSQDIKYAPDTIALRNAGDVGEVMDMAETTEVNENAPDEYPGDHVGPSTMDVGNADARRLDGLRMPDAAPPRARYASHPNIQPAVRRSAPRPDTDNQPPDTTDRTENNTTAVRSLAPRPWHATVQLNKTTSWRPRPLCYIGLMTHIILLLLHNGDGGVEPCSPPANTTNQTTYQNITTHYGMANGGAERRSPPTMPTITTVRSPAPRPCTTQTTR